MQRGVEIHVSDCQHFSDESCNDTAFISDGPCKENLPLSFHFCAVLIMFIRQHSQIYPFGLLSPIKYNHLLSLPGHSLWVAHRQYKAISFKQSSCQTMHLQTSESHTLLWQLRTSGVQYYLDLHRNKTSMFQSSQCKSEVNVLHNL